MSGQGAGLPPREAMEFDTVIVGAGPAGLAAAIRLKELAAAAGQDISAVVIGKGSEGGAHILSGAVIDPKGLNALIPDWKEKGAPAATPVTTSRFLDLGPAGCLNLPGILMLPLMNNPGNCIVSVAQVCIGQFVRWLGEQEAELGVEIYPGFAQPEVLFDGNGAVTGVATGETGVDRDGKPGGSCVRGIGLRGKNTLLAEGARGSPAKQLIARFKLDEGCEPRKFGIGGLQDLHQPGLPAHSGFDPSPRGGLRGNIEPFPQRCIAAEQKNRAGHVATPANLAQVSCRPMASTPIR